MFMRRCCVLVIPMTITLTQITGYLKQPRNWPRVALYFLFGNFFLQLALAFLPLFIGHAHALTFNPDLSGRKIALQTEETDYKTTRLREMAAMWKGTILESHTVPLLSMLLQEDGTLSSERWHDCRKGVCYSIGMMGHHICFRGTPLIYGGGKTYCTWKDGKSPQEQFTEDYPDFVSEWRVQFAEYTLRMTKCIESGKTDNQCIQAWNSREEGRIAKVNSHKSYVVAALEQ